MTQVDRVPLKESGKSPPETISCDPVQWPLEFISGSPFDGMESKSKKWACMPAEDENIDAHDDDYRDSDDGFAGGECGAGSVTKKGPWTAEEDEKLKKCVDELGIGNWITIEKCSGLGRTSKSCRLRWTNHLRPHLKKGSFTREEERLVVKLHKTYGNKWSYIASKLPGRTDNEVKNFWHGRVRRCHRKFLPIYPKNIEDDQSCKYGLDIDGKTHLDNEFHSPNLMDETKSILPFPSITLPEYENTLQEDAPIQEKPNSMNNQNPPFTFTLPETQLFSPHQGPVSSPHGLSSSSLTSPGCYTNQMPASALNLPSQNGHPSIQLLQSTETSGTSTAPQNPLLSFQENYSSPRQSNSNSAVTFTPLRPPPVLSSLGGRFKKSQRTCSLPLSTPKITHFSVPEQGSPISASGSSITSLRTNASSPTTSHFHSPRMHLSVASSEPLYTSSIPSDLSSSNLNSQDLNTETNETPCSFLSFNQRSSIKPNSCLPHNHFKNPSLISPPAWDYSVSEPPSVQTPTSAFRPIPEMNITQLGTDTEILDAPTLEAIAKADISYQKSLEDQCVDETFKENEFHQRSGKGSFFCGKTRKLNSLGQSLKPQHPPTKKPKTQDLANQRFCRKNSHGKYFKLENSTGQVSRREGLLSEISRTGILLVEREKKETILRGLLDQHSTQEVLARKRSMTKEMQLVEISRREKQFGESLCVEYLQSEMYNGKESVDEKSEKNVPLCGNFASSRKAKIQRLEEILFDISPRRSISLNLQKQTCDQDAFGEVSCDISRGDDMLASRGQEDEFKAPDPILSHCTEMAFSKSGDERDNLNYSGPANVQLNGTLREECPDTSKGEWMQNQAQICHYICDDLFFDGLLTSQDQHEILHESVWGPNQCTTINPLSLTRPEDIWSSIQPCGDDLFRADLRGEVSSCRNMKNEVSLEKYSGERFPVESLSERTTARHELNVNEFISSTSKSMEAQTHCSTGFGQCYEAAKTKQDIVMEEAYNTLPEEFSSLLEFFPAYLPDSYCIGSEPTSISDMAFGLEMHHYPSMK